MTPQNYPLFIEWESEQWAVIGWVPVGEYLDNPVGALPMVIALDGNNRMAETLKASDAWTVLPHPTVPGVE
jgi:hypothetical protein